MDNVKDIHMAMPIHNLIEYCDNYSINNGAIVNFNEANATDSFNSKAKIAG